MMCWGRYGGNKTRKLEYLLAEAQELRARKVVTFGGLNPITPARP